MSELFFSLPKHSSDNGSAVAVVGATGAVGRELIALLDERAFPAGELRLLASSRSAGAQIPYRGQSLRVAQMSRGQLEGVSLAFFCASGAVSREWAPAVISGGGVVIDNSAAFRMDAGAPLIVPEVNGAELDAFRKRGEPGLIANPNCSTILLVMALTPIRTRFGVERVVVSTYQAASGAGGRAMRELEDQTRAVLAGEKPETHLFAEQYAFNLFSHDSAVSAETGRNEEEQKMIDETRKIWRDPALKITATCVRVPVMRAHGQSANIRLRHSASEVEIREALAQSPGVRVVDDRVANRFPTPLAATGEDDVLVGRIRPDRSQESDGSRFLGFDLFLTGDQLRKGAALNALQIAQRLVRGTAL